MVEAIYLEKFTRFIEWPDDTNVYDTTENFVIGIVGEDSFEGVLETIYGSYPILNKNVQIIHDVTDKNFENCNLIFINILNEKSLDRILSLLKGKPILTISHNKGFAEEGVHINFINIGNKIRFEVNKKSMEESKLKASHLLLKQAIII